MTRRQQACFVAYAGVLLAGFLVPLQACQELPAEKQEEITTTEPVVRKGEIQTRKYAFKKAGKEMDYVLYVPKLYEPGKKMPLVVALHGLGSTPGQIMRYPGLTKLAEKYGFIVVAPWVYNNRGWYGSLGQKSRRSRPENLGELSELDVMNVLAIVRRDFKIDDQRIYLMGHSMGGGGTFHLAIKYPDIWTALGTVAPAVYAAPDRLTEIQHLPVIVVQGDRDRLVSVKQTRVWIEKMKELKMKHVYIEVAGGGHIYVAFNNMPRIFEFFSKQVRKQLPVKQLPTKVKPAPQKAVGS